MPWIMIKQWIIIFRGGSYASIVIKGLKIVRLCDLIPSPAVTEARGLPLSVECAATGSSPQCILKLTIMSDIDRGSDTSNQTRKSKNETRRSTSDTGASPGAAAAGIGLDACVEDVLDSVVESLLRDPNRKFVCAEMASQLEYFVGKNSTGPSTYGLGDALGITQHHDAITGTAKQHATDDWAKCLAAGATEAKTLVNSSLSCLANKSIGQCTSPASTFSQVSDVSVVVLGSLDNKVQTQYVSVDNVMGNLRNFYVQAYLGLSPGQAPKYLLVFQVSVPPFGWSTYFISRASGTGNRTNGLSVVMLQIGPGNLKFSFFSTTGQLRRVANTETGGLVLQSGAELSLPCKEKHQQPDLVS